MGFVLKQIPCGTFLNVLSTEPGYSSGGRENTSYPVVLPQEDSSDGGLCGGKGWW